MDEIIIVPICLLLNAFFAVYEMAVVLVPKSDDVRLRSGATVALNLRKEASATKNEKEQLAYPTIYF